MVSHKHKAPYLVASGLFLACLLALAMISSSRPAPITAAAKAADSNQREPAGSRERLRKLLTERYDLLTKIVESMQPHLEAGRIDIVELRDATAAMHRAKADLCTTAAERVKVYETLVDLLRTYEQRIAHSVAAGRAPEVELDKARVATLEAQIELEKQKLAMRASP